MPQPPTAATADDADDADGMDFVETWTAEASQTSYVNDVAYAEIDAHPAVVAVADGTVTVWDLESGEPLTRSPDAHADLVCVAVTQSAGKPVAVTGDMDGRIQVWDLIRGAAPHGDPLTMLDGRVHAVAATPGLGRGLALIARGAGATSTVYSVPVADQTVEVWDLAARKRLRALNHGGYTDSVALGESGARAVAVASASFSASPLIDPSDQESRVFLWDLETGDLIGEPLEPAREGDPIDSVAVGDVAGRTIVVGVCSGRLHVWERGELRPGAWIPDSDRTAFVAWGGTADRPLVLASGGGDPRRPDRRSWLGIWDPQDWRLLARTEPGFGSLQRFAPAPGGRVILPWGRSVKVLRCVPSKGDPGPLDKLS